MPGCFPVGVRARAVAFWRAIILPRPPCPNDRSTPEGGTMSNTAPITLAIDGAIARLVLARPRQHNALGAREIELFLALLDQVEAEPGVRVLLLRGSGER